MMSDDAPSLTIAEEEKPGIPQLLGQLASDTGDFARAEIAFLRAAAGERASYALPGIIMVALGTALASGAVVALLVGLVLWLDPIIGIGLAILASIGGSLIVAIILFQLGTTRLKNALKPRNER
jgi:Putative Actinobacterial Holin-X, holin superfamily III